MAKTAEKKTDIVRTGVFMGKVKVKIDPEATKLRGARNTEIDLKIEEYKEEMKPTKEKVTALRAEKRKLLKEMGDGYAEEERQVYELKDFAHGVAAIHDAETDEKVGERNLVKKDYHTDLEDRPEADA